NPMKLCDISLPLFRRNHRPLIGKGNLGSRWWRCLSLCRPIRLLPRINRWGCKLIPAWLIGLKGQLCAIHTNRRPLLGCQTAFGFCNLGGFLCGVLDSGFVWNARRGSDIPLVALSHSGTSFDISGCVWKYPACAWLLYGIFSSWL